MTDLPVFSGTLDGTELMEVVAAPAGQTNEAAGVNYQITTLLLAQLLAQVGITTVIIGNGEYTDPAHPYVPASDVARIYVNKSIASATYIQFALASGYIFEPLVKDIAGTAAAGLGVSVTFTSGQKADNNSTVPIETPYGGYFFRPIADVGAWTLGSA